MPSPATLPSAVDGSLAPDEGCMWPLSVPPFALCFAEDADVVGILEGAARKGFRVWVLLLLLLLMRWWWWWWWW